MHVRCSYILSQYRAANRGLYTSHPTLTNQHNPIILFETCGYSFFSPKIMNTPLLFVCIVFSTFQCTIGLKETPVIQTKLGPVIGEVIEIGGMEIYHFGSIPYAEPMLGNLRYKKTVPKKPWTEVLNVGPAADQCFQWGYGEEDCLKISVWVKKSVYENAVKNKKLASVFNYIHGGGFRGGSMKGDDMLYIAAYSDLVATVLQYRLGSLGFAYLGNEDVPGNMGLWDQLEALKWVRDNIEAFGGNNKQITILGESAGGASVTLHLLSPQSRGKGLYRSAIAQSGSASCPWASHSAELSLKVTNIIFDKICPDEKAMDKKLECLRALPVRNVSAQDIAADHLGYSEMAIGPTVDGDFLPRDAASMLKDGDLERVPLIFSSTKDEGAFFMYFSRLAKEYLPDKEHPNRLDQLTYKEYQLFLHERFHVLTDPVPLLHDTIELQYWPRNHEGYPKGREVFEATEHAEGDYAFTCPVFQVGKAMAKHVNNVFALFYTHRRKNHWTPEWTGVMHSDGMVFISGQTFNSEKETEFTQEEKDFGRSYMKYYKNFIECSDPNGKGDDPTLRYWPRFVGENCSEQYFEFNVKTIVTNVTTTDATICNLKARECLFWQDLIPQENEALTRVKEYQTTAEPPKTTAAPNTESEKRTTKKSSENAAWRNQLSILVLMLAVLLTLLV